MKKQRDKILKRRIFLVDDHPLVREFLAQLINQQDDLEVCGDCAEATECMQLLTTARADLVVVDLSLEKTHGFDLIKDLRLQHPRLPVLVLSMHDEAAYVERALRAGARGYLTKTEATQLLLPAIRCVLTGEMYVSEKVAGKVVGLFLRGYGATDPNAPTSRLSDRELQIFELIGRGYPTKQIAAVLKVTVKTVDTHRANLKEKLGVATIEELRAAAEKWAQRTLNP
ncbi:MAG: response regulator transcription factor [Verrucomicrobiota bacterium]